MPIILYQITNIIIRKNVYYANLICYTIIYARRARVCIIKLFFLLSSNSQFVIMAIINLRESIYSNLKKNLKMCYG